MDGKDGSDQYSMFERLQVLQVELAKGDSAYRELVVARDQYYGVKCALAEAHQQLKEAQAARDKAEAARDKAAQQSEQAYRYFVEKKTAFDVALEAPLRLGPQPKARQ